jgi:pimeloyl-ACP methyl ester carboxylesterase
LDQYEKHLGRPDGSFFTEIQAVAIDLPGSGESGNNRSSWTMNSFGADVAAVINKLKLKKVVLVGFSMGAGVVVETANLMSEKVIGLVLVDDLQDPDFKYTREMITYMDSIMMDVVTAPNNEKLVAGGFYKKNEEASFKRILNMYDGVSHIGWKESLHGYIEWIKENCIESLKQLKVPVIAINSYMQPTNIEVFRKYVPGFHAKIMTDVGHVVFWDNGEEFNRLLEESIQEIIKSSESN